MLFMVCDTANMSFITYQESVTVKRREIRRGEKRGEEQNRAEQSKGGNRTERKEKDRAG
jgi:hypothetical protein